MHQYLDSEKELLLQIAQGNETAFRLFFELYWPQVYGTSLRLTRMPEMAKDLSQEIFIKVWANRDKLPEVKQLDAYIYVVSRNLIMDYLRKKVFDDANIDLLIDYICSDEVIAHDKMEYKELQQLLREAVNRLPGKVRDVFILSRYEGLTHEQIAAKLNISVTSSKTYVVRALQEIRTFLAGHPEKVIAIAFVLLKNLQK
jgi:RNA polymerase sigma-70 factor (ECF subfamily)